MGNKVIEISMSQSESGTEDMETCGFRIRDETVVWVCDTSSCPQQFFTLASCFVCFLTIFL